MNSEMTDIMVTISNNTKEINGPHAPKVEIALLEREVHDTNTLSLRDIFQIQIHKWIGSNGKEKDI